MTNTPEKILADLLKLANRHGNIKPDVVRAYFGVEPVGSNKDNVHKFVKERLDER